jgi:hypothetical protein
MAAPNPFGVGSVRDCRVNTQSAQPVEFMHHCSTKWATFLLSLKDWLERAEGRPAPYDVKIHAGD